MVTDVDGNLYNTVQVGTQCWLKENLRTTHYANGESIPMTTGGYGYCYRYLPNGDSANLQTYGYLYDWNATTHSFSGSNPNQGACPTGWHVPTIGELNALFSFVKNTSWLWCDSNRMCDAAALADSVGWDNSPYQCAPGYAGGSNNMSGFSARPAGMYNGVGSNTYASLGRTAFFWSSTLVPPQTPVYPRMKSIIAGWIIQREWELPWVVPVRQMRCQSDVCGIDPLPSASRKVYLDRPPSLALSVVCFAGF